MFVVITLGISLIVYKIYNFIWLRRRIKLKLDNLKFIEKKLNKRWVDIFVELKRFLKRLKEKGIITDKENIGIYKLVVFYLKYDEVEDLLIVQNNKRIIVYLDKFYEQLLNDLINLN